MELVILGCSGTYPTPTNACSGYLVRHDGYTLWMDAGNGTLARLQEHVDLLSVDALLLSHVHLDHCADIYPFFYAHFTAPDPRAKPVFAPPGVRERLQALVGPETADSWRTFLDWQEVAPGQVLELGPLQVEAFDAAHSTANVTARISAGGRTLAYSGDTGPNPHLARAAKDADLFLCEASWLDDDATPLPPIHLRAGEAGAAARAAGAGRLMLTHMWPNNDRARMRAQASDTFGADVELAVESGRTVV